MPIQFLRLLLALLFVAAVSPAEADDQGVFVSVSRGGELKKDSGPGTLMPETVQVRRSPDRAVEEAHLPLQADKPPSKRLSAAQDIAPLQQLPAAQQPPSDRPGVEVGQPPSVSQALLQAAALYKASPGTATFSEVLRQLKAALNEASLVKAPAQSVIKANPVLGELGVKVFEAGPGRIFAFPKVCFCREIIVQWVESRAEISFVGRHHRKKVTYVTCSKLQSLLLPEAVRLKDGRIVAGKDGQRVLILCGESKGTSMWLGAYQAEGGLWRERPDYFDSIPAFLTKNVSGKVTFRDADLLFTVARVVPAATVAAGVNTGALPESDSSTYKFWLALTESGYALESHLADEEPYRIVYQFLQAFQQGKTDSARAYLTESKLLSIPKYLGLRIPQTPYRVAEMSAPWSGGYRFRLVTFLKDDLIFDVGKVKDKMLIKAIFIAPPDPFLQEIAKNLPLFDKISEPPPPPSPKPAAEVVRTRRQATGL